MTPSEPLSQVTHPDAIRATFDWHVQQGVGLTLMMGSSGGHTSARLVGLNAADGCLEVVCTGVRDVAPGFATRYALIGTLPKGGSFLASGKIAPCAGTVDNFLLSFPDWIDISQSRDCFRCPVPADYQLHFSSLDPHLNDIVCRVENVSLGGLAVEWDRRESCAAPARGALTDDAILYAGNNQVALGKLRVTHVTQRKRSLLLGLAFERDAPRTFGALVLDAQRAHYLT